MIEYRCECGYVMSLWGDLAGKKVRCPKCATEGVVSPMGARPEEGAAETGQPGRPADSVKKACASAGDKAPVRRPFYVDFVATSLLPGEEVLYSARLHWIVFAWPIIWLLAGFVSYRFIASEGDEFLRASASIVILGAMAAMVRAVMRFLASEFALTNRRVIVKYGFFRRMSIETLLEWIEGIYVYQGVIGRLVNFGTLSIAGVGGTRGPYRRISNPLKFRMRVQEQLTTGERLGGR